MNEKRALLLVGSPRGLEKSTSGRFGGRLLDALAGQAFKTDRVHTHAAVQTPVELDKALAAVAAAHLVVLSLPLYVDSFPAPAISFLEEVARRGVGRGHVQFALLIQCGFPENAQNDTAVAIAKQFAAEAGWTWLGALALGAAQTYSGTANEALDRVAAALAGGHPIPRVYVRAGMPAWLYRIGGNLMWRREAKKLGTARKLRAQPYRAESEIRNRRSS